MKLVSLSKFNKLVRDQRGAGMVEYIILVGVVALRPSPRSPTPL
jgi:hypothetical protein